MNRRALAPALRSVPLRWLVGLSCLGFLASSGLAEPVSLPGLCGQLSVAGLADGAAMAMSLWSPAVLAWGWLVMVAAMMPVLLAQPVAHILRSVPPRRRARALGLFALGYTAVWGAAGLLLVPASVLLRLAAPGLAGALLALAFAFAWSASPAAQAARNRCHRVQPIAASGAAADRDSLRYGLSSGSACAAACWPWMVVPVAFETGHLAAMAAVTLLLFFDRTAPAAAVRWRTPPGLVILAALARPLRQKVVGSL